MPRIVAVLLLVLCTMIWGLAFSAQKAAMDTMQPLTFAAVRLLLGGIIVLPLAFMEHRRKTKAGQGMTRRSWILTGIVTLVFFLGSWLQQVGLATTTVTNAGFITSLYVLFVPVIAFIVARTRPHPALYVAVPMALIGIFYLNGGRLDQFNSGDLLVMFCAVFWGAHVYWLGIASKESNQPFVISAVSFLGGGLASLILTLIIETPTLDGIMAGWVAILYVGIVSTAIAFTLQAIAQQYVPPANAAIILSAESLFAALGGAILLNERLPLIGYAGAALIFFAIILVEVVPLVQQRRLTAAAAKA